MLWFEFGYMSKQRGRHLPSLNSYIITIPEMRTLDYVLQNKHHKYIHGMV